MKLLTVDGFSRFMVDIEHYLHLHVCGLTHYRIVPQQLAREEIYWLLVYVSAPEYKGERFIAITVDLAVRSQLRKELEDRKLWKY